MQTRLLIHHHHIWCIHTVHKYSYKYVQVESAHITHVTVHARHFLWLENSNIHHRNPSLHNCFSSPLSKGRTTPTPVDGKPIKWDVFYALWLLFPFRIALLQIAISGKVGHPSASWSIKPQHIFWAPCSFFGWQYSKTSESVDKRLSVAWGDPCGSDLCSFLGKEGIFQGRTPFYEATGSSEAEGMIVLAVLRPSF